MQIKRWLRYRYLKIIRTPDSPHRVAGGVAVGVFLNFLPTMGLGVVLAFFLSRLFHTNIPVALLSSLGTKWAIPAMYVLNLKTGQILLGQETETLRTIWRNVAGMEWQELLKLGAPFLVGSVTNSILAALVIYGVFVYFLIKWHWKRRRPVKNH